MVVKLHIRQLCALCLCCLLLMGLFPVSAQASASSTNTDLQLHSKNTGESQKIHAANLFPGDTIHQTYRLKVYYRDQITVHFGAEIRPGYDKLAEVLFCRLTLEGKTVFEGLLRDLPGDLPYTIKAPDTELVYDLTVWMDTSVGNEYMNLEFIADWKWWVEKQEFPSLTDSPRTGDSFNLTLWAAILVLSGGSLLILARKKKKEDPDGRE